MLCFPLSAPPDFQNPQPARPEGIKPRTIAAFLCATALVVASGVTLVSGLGKSLAFDDSNPAAFFRADRARMQAAAPARATVPTTSSSNFLARITPDAATAKPKATKKHAERKPTDKGERVKVAAVPGQNATDNPVGVHTGTGSQSVCVRLCDGYHFPVGDASDAGNVAAHEATCAATCPGAPTRLFVLPAGTDDINRAYSARGGQSYSALPVAFRHAQKRDNTCSCRAAGSPQQAMTTLYRDYTLRQGDAVMTGQGVRVFRGARKLPYQPRDFSGLSSSSLGASERRILQAIDKATVPRLDTWREKPLTQPISTATPVPALGPFRVRGRATASAVQIEGPQAEANIGAYP